MGSVAPPVPIYLNSAGTTATELQKISGITPAMAKAAIEYRDQKMRQSGEAVYRYKELYGLKGWSESMTDSFRNDREHPLMLTKRG
jgi:hypothetical protein